MSRSLSGALAAHLGGGATTLAAMLRLDLMDGTVLAFTDHDLPLAFNLGDGSAEYQPWTGVNISAVALSSGFDVSNFEVTGPIGDLVSRLAVTGGRLRRAKARLFLVNWAALGQGPARIMAGRVATARVEGSRFVLQVRNAMAAFNASQGSVLGPYCRADFGVKATGCPVVREPAACTVTAVQDAFTFAVDLGGEHPDNWFFLGAAAFLTGSLAGTAEAKVFAYDGTTGGIELFEPLVQPPEVGDTLNLYRGCSKLLKHANPIVPTCLGYAAVLDFRGEPELPGNRTFLRISAPGAAYA